MRFDTSQHKINYINCLFLRTNVNAQSVKFCALILTLYSYFGIKTIKV